MKPRAALLAWAAGVAVDAREPCVGGIDQEGTVDHKGFVWVGGNGNSHVLKLAREGKAAIHLA